MNREEYLQLITDIGTCEDEAERRTMLASLTDESNGLFDTNEELTQSVTDLTDKNQKLKDANSELFLQVTRKKDPNDVRNNELGHPGEERKPRKYEDLFDEKGGLK